MLSGLILASQDGDRLSPNELLAMSFLLILAGYETTVNLIGNGVLALLRAPVQMALLRSNPTLLPTAVEEFLRFESPLNTATNRFTVAPITVGDVEIPAGQFIFSPYSRAGQQASRPLVSAAASRQHGHRDAALDRQRQLRSRCPRAGLGDSRRLPAGSSRRPPFGAGHPATTCG